MPSTDRPTPLRRPLALAASGIALLVAGILVGRWLANVL